jgi:beta-lactamase regulating signal transducer with metallopeptidase domain
MNPWMQVTGWTLIHFVWQGALLALVTAAGLRRCRHRSAETRYAVACIGLIAMLVAPIVTAAIVRAPGSILLIGESMLPAASGSAGAVRLQRESTGDVLSPSSTNGGTAIGKTRMDALLSYVVWGWLAGASLLLARFAGGCWRVHRLRRASLREPVSPWQSASERLAARLGVTVAFRVVDSGVVDAPGVIGSIRPLILLPVAVLTNMAPAQIEMILAHELAHIRRRDYAMNLFQTVAEALLFYHPCVWWVSARIREAREHCCDDVAVEICGEPTEYAAALAELASWRTRDAALAVGATDGPLLVRVRRLLHVQENDAPRSISGLAVLAVGTLLATGVVLQSSTLPPTTQAATAVAQPAGDWRIRKTDHFEIQYPPDLDLHAERVAEEAERAYAQVSSELKHNLAFTVPVILFHTTSELERSVQAGSLGRHVASFSDPARDRIALAMDRSADQSYGLITHEVAHVFGFDILPGTATPRWIAEGLAEYLRGAWDPSDLVVLRESVRANAIPRISGLQGDGAGADPRLVSGLGHAAFDFIESRWGKSGVRQFILRLRQTATNGGDPYQAALQVGRDEFDQAFERYLTGRFAASVGASRAERFDLGATVRIEGDIHAIRFPAPVGLACLELLVQTEGATGRPWGVECGDGTEPAVMRALKPGDRVILTGAPARQPAAQRMIMQSLARASDGLTWRAH